MPTAVRIFTLLALLVSPMVAAAESAVEYQPNVQYGTGGDTPLMLNLARPKQHPGKLPVVVVIHGGGWVGGNKDMHDPQIKELAARGYLAVSVGYRLAPAHPFPAQIEDCKCAVRWLRAHADQWNIDPDRIGALGFSAGAHLAMLLGVMDAEDGLEGDGGWPDQPSKVQAVVSFAGPTDLSLELPPVSVEIVEKFLGGELSTRQNEIRRASPITYVSRGDAPMLLFQGTNDEIVPRDQAFAMTTALSKASVPGRIELLVGAGHGWNEPEVARTIRVAYEFLDHHLRAPGE